MIGTPRVTSQVDSGASAGGKHRHSSPTTITESGCSYRRTRPGWQSRACSATQAGGSSRKAGAPTTIRSRSRCAEDSRLQREPEAQSVFAARNLVSEGLCLRAFEGVGNPLEGVFPALRGQLLALQVRQKVHALEVSPYKLDQLRRQPAVVHIGLACRRRRQAHSSFPIPGSIDAARAGTGGHRRPKDQGSKLAL